MSPIFISSLIGITISLAALSQAVPSVANIVKLKTVDVGISREAALMQQIIRYKGIEGSYPATVADLVAKGYWRAVDDDNNYGGSYSFTVDAAKNFVAIQTLIADATKRDLYLKSFKRSYKPIDLGGGIVQTNFLIPNVGSAATQIPSTEYIRVSATDPGASINTYWYDTSGPLAILKVSNGATWSAATSGTVGSSTGGGGTIADSTKIANSFAELPGTATVGDVRYVYNSATSMIDTAFYYNGAWNVAGSSPSSTSLVTRLVLPVIPNASLSTPFNLDLKPYVKAFFSKTYGVVSVDAGQLTFQMQGTLPAGLTFSNGVISGTPTAVTAQSGVMAYFSAIYQGTASPAEAITLKVSPALLLVQKVSIGNNYVCALTTAGGVKCWGVNAFGQLGNGTTVTSTIPVDVTGLTSGVIDIAAGGNTTCAIVTGGQVKCWGTNTLGQFGTGSTTPAASTTPVNSLATGMSSISNGGGNHLCGLTTTGGVKCWGAGTSGQLGNAASANSSTPVNVSGLTAGATSVSASGQFFSCATTSAGEVKCWGSNTVGQLGNGTTTSSNIPVTVNGLTSGATSVASGFQHSCANTSDKGVLCWGAGAAGQLGNSLSADSSFVVSVANHSSGISSIDTASTISCSVNSGGAASCWGLNTGGQLGNGSIVNSNIPTSVIGMNSGVRSIHIGRNALGSVTCAVKTDNTVQCWGKNTSGGEVGLTTETPLITSTFTAPTDPVRLAVWP